MGLFDSNERTKTLGNNELMRYYQSTGQLYNPALPDNKKYAGYAGDPWQTAPNFRQIANEELGGFTDLMKSLSDRFRAEGGGNVRSLFEGLMGLGEGLNTSGSAFGKDMLTRYGAGTDEIMRRADEATSLADQWGVGRADQINKDYDVALNRGFGNIGASMFARGLGNSSITGGNMAMLSGEMERARHSSLQNASESAIDRSVGGRNFATTMLAGRESAIPDLMRTGEDYATRGFPLMAAAEQARGAGMESLLAQLLGFDAGTADRRLGLLAQPGAIMPDPFPAGYQNMRQSSSGGFANALGAFGLGAAADLGGGFFGSLFD